MYEDYELESRRLFVTDESVDVEELMDIYFNSEEDE